MLHTAQMQQEHRTDTPTSGSATPTRGNKAEWLEKQTRIHQEGRNPNPKPNPNPNPTPSPKPQPQPQP